MNMAAELEADTSFSVGSAAVQKRRLVISIDFGTTYTGIAFATPLGETATFSDIDIVTNWGKGYDNHDKVKSVISYSDRSEENENNWGDNVAPDAVVMKHLKLKLDVQAVSEELNFLTQALDGTNDLNFQHIRNAKNLPEYTSKSSEVIVKDYLTKVFEHVLDVVDTFSKELRDRIDTDIVITIPVEWSYVAKNSTYWAVTNAGFNSETFPRLKDIMFVTEPEAAAIYTSRYFKEEMRLEFLKLKECFILCDAGGGTVDIVSYQVKQLEPRLELKRIGFPTGRKCGSIFIDQDFKDWLRRLLGDRYFLELEPNADLNRIYGTEGRALRDLMARFDTIKKEFHTNSGPMYLDLPKPLNNLTLDNRVEGGQITISNQQMRAFFNPHVDEIVGMVRHHIQIIDHAGFRAKNLFLVGGFGESKFLREELGESLRMREGRQLRIPESSWTAVARGGAICGIEKTTMPNILFTGVCPKHYGIAVDKSFASYNDERDQATHPISGKLIAKNQMRWLLSKGDVVCSDEPTVASHNFTINFRENDPEKMRGTVIIYSFPDEKEERPDRLSNSRSELSREHTLDFDLSDRQLTEFERRHNSNPSKDYYATTITLKLSLSKNDLGKEQPLKAELLWKGSILGPVGLTSRHVRNTSTRSRNSYGATETDRSSSFVRVADEALI